MLLRWENRRAVADREMLATIYEVSDRTVRRYCTPVRHEVRRGQPRGRGGIALYDVLDAGAHLQGVAPRPARTAALAIYRMNPRRQESA
jgi:hypothetical protein